MVGGVVFMVIALAAATHLSSATVAVFNLVVGVVWLAIETHMRYQPWCPWCDHSGGGGGGHDPAPAPPTGPTAKLHVAAR
ncbi:hypothetical protein GCM10009603_59470 [Nocardiopsis exhalans]